MSDDDDYTIDMKTGRRRKKPVTKKRKAEAAAASARRPPIYAPPVPPTPHPAVPASPTHLQGDAEQDIPAAGPSAPRQASPAAAAAAAPPPPAPYDFQRDEPTYGTFIGDPLEFEIPQAKKRGPVRIETKREVPLLMS